MRRKGKGKRRSKSFIAQRYTEEAQRFTEKRIRKVEGVLAR